MNRSYCVVGGGISGLTAAYRLRQSAGGDATITLFDPADRLGGVLRTEQVAGVSVDVGAEAFVVRRPEMPALLAELGLAYDQLGTTGARPLIYSQSRLHPLPTGTLIGIPSSSESMAGLVNDATLARIAAEPDQPLSWRPGAAPAGGLAAGAASVTDAARQALTSATAGPIFGAVGGGYRVLVEELVLHSRTTWVPAAVDGIEAVPAGGWMLRDSTGAQWKADGVIFAVPAARLADLVETVAPRTAAAAGRIDTASSAVLAMAVPRGIAFPQNSGVLVASGEELHAKAITLSSRKWGRRTDVELLRLSFGRFGDDLATRASDDELLAWALEDLATVFGLTVS